MVFLYIFPHGLCASELLFTSSLQSQQRALKSLESMFRSLFLRFSLFLDSSTLRTTLVQPFVIEEYLPQQKKKHTES